MELRSGKGRHDNSTGDTNKLELDTGQTLEEDANSSMERKDGKEIKGNDDSKDKKTEKTGKADYTQEDLDYAAFDAIMDDSDDTAERQWYRDKVKSWKDKKERRTNQDETTVDLQSSSDEAKDSDTDDESSEENKNNENDEKQEQEDGDGEDTENNTQKNHTTRDDQYDPEHHIGHNKTDTNEDEDNRQAEEEEYKERTMRTPTSSPNRRAVPHVTPKPRENEHSNRRDKERQNSESESTSGSTKTTRSEDGSDGEHNPPVKRKVTENPYQRRGSNASSDFKPTFTDVLTGRKQTQLKTHEKIRETYDTLFEVTFDASRYHPMNPTLRDDALVLEQRIHSILVRAKEVDKKAKINTWLEERDAPTITKSADIPETHAELLLYLNHVYTDRRIRAGRNNGWRIRITSSIPQDEFLHYWGLTKMEFKKVEFVTLRRAPLQHTSFYIAGYLLNSSDGQLVDILEDKLSKEMGCKVGVESRTAPLEKRSSDIYWNEAKQTATDAHGNVDRQKLFRNAPFAQGVYVEDRQKAVMVAGRMHEMYGRQTDDKLQYPRLPDGTRMRFMPASIYLDMAGRQKAGELFRQQIFFQNNSTIAPIQIRDPGQKFEAHENRSMQELLLDLVCEEKVNEPYFRHIKKKFTRNWKANEYEVSIHNEMYPYAAKVLRNLQEIMTEKYSKEVGDAIMNPSEEETRSMQNSTSAWISIDPSDRYMNGPANFVILGMEQVSNVLSNIRQQGEDDRSLQVKSNMTGYTGHTGQTRPEAPYYMDDPTRRSRTSHPSSLTTASSMNELGWTRQGDEESEKRMAESILRQMNKEDTQDDQKDDQGTPTTRGSNKQHNKQQAIGDDHSNRDRRTTHAEASHIAQTHNRYEVLQGRDNRQRRHPSGRGGGLDRARGIPTNNGVQKDVDIVERIIQTNREAHNTEESETQLESTVIEDPTTTPSTPDTTQDKVDASNEESQ